MSHFSVAVFTDENTTVEDLLETRFIKTANPEWTLTIVDCHI